MGLNQYAMPFSLAAGTNTGHDTRQEPFASFAVNRQKLLDDAFRSLHVSTAAVRA
jgi:hypothetical protein